MNFITKTDGQKGHRLVSDAENRNAIVSGHKPGTLMALDALNRLYHRFGKLRCREGGCGEDYEATFRTSHSTTPNAA